MTLLELLIVVGIMLLVAALLVPRLQPMMDHSKIREAARAIQLYLSSARNLAISTGRSCGVIIEPLPADNGCSMTLKQVETPVPYGGESLSSTATVTYTGSNSANHTATCTISFPNSPTSITLYPGDLIQVGYQGFWLNQLGINPIAPGTTSIQANIDISHGEMPFWLNLPKGTPSQPLPYKILRWPVKSAANDLQLPAGTVIDLTWSGWDPLIAGDSATLPLPPTPPAASPTPVTIMFAADGKIDWLASSGTATIGGNQEPMIAGQNMLTPIYLMVGMRNKVMDNPSGNANTNLNDFNSLWVAIDTATGLIVVADPAAVGTTNTVLLTPQAGGGTPPDSRYYARQASANAGGK
jgi:type II secretory pathway pseudopilin PulG